DPHTADARSDLYSLGCTFYFLLTGIVPFPMGNTVNKLIRHSTEEPAAVNSLRPDVGPRVAAIVHRLLAKRPEDRHQSAAELVTELTALQTEDASHGGGLLDGRTAPEPMTGRVPNFSLAVPSLASPLEPTTTLLEGNSVTNGNTPSGPANPRRFW